MDVELTNKQTVNYDKIQEKAKIIRFESLEAAIVIETLISEILVDYLGNDKSRLSLQKYLFYDTLSFDQKVNLFNSLNKAKAFELQEVYKELNSDLVKIRIIRNYMAHSMIDTTLETLDSYNDREIKFVSFTSKNMKAIVTFKFYEMQDDVEKLIFSYNALAERFNKVFDALGYIKSQLKKREN